MQRKRGHQIALPDGSIDADHCARYVLVAHGGKLIESRATKDGTVTLSKKGIGGPTADSNENPSLWFRVTVLESALPRNLMRGA
jgi:hypothetical protein